MKRWFMIGLVLAGAVVGHGQAGRWDDARVRVQLVPRASAVLSAEVSAVVQRLPVQEGAAFAVGDVLVVFDSSLQAAQLERAEAQLQAAEVSAAAAAKLLQLKSGGEVEANLAAADVRKAKAEVRYASEMLARCTLRAPFAGRLALRRLQEHEFAQAGQPVLEIIATGGLEVEFIAPSRKLERWQPGSRISFTIDETGSTYHARVARAPARVDSASQSIKVVATLEGSPPELIPGMSGSLVNEGGATAH
jgi:membrane fusion protein (multidrug efflux system)